MRIGVDAGGTFTDFVIVHDSGAMETFKLRSNPRSPASVIFAGLAQAAGSRPAEVIHGSTVATNALLERKGARTALVTTAGFEDVIHIGRQNRAELYNLTPSLRVPIIPRSKCFGLGERAYFDGTIAASPRAGEIAKLRARLKTARIESVAICFLHAYRNSKNEQQVADSLKELGYVCCSHDVCPEFREYERSATTLINAYVGPLMDRYLAELERGRHSVAIMQSNGGFMSTKEARRHAIRTVLSGPAGGVIGARRNCAPLRIFAHSRFRYGRNVHRCQPLRRQAARDHGGFHRWLHRPRADAGYSHRGRGRRLHRARR